jgi:hypothetical protein
MVDLTSRRGWATTTAYLVNVITGHVLWKPLRRLRQRQSRVKAPKLLPVALSLLYAYNAARSNDGATSATWLRADAGSLLNAKTPFIVASREARVLR